MKRIVLLALFASLFGSFALKGQSCLPSGIVVSTQAQIDNFPSNYPGCSNLAGSIWIKGGVANLDSLSVLTHIGGSLIITDCTVLSSLEGLNQLTTIGGDLQVENNTALHSFIGLDQLASIGGNLDIQNSVFPSLNGLNQLTTVGGDFIVEGVISSLMGLDNLVLIGGNFEMPGHLTSLTGLEQLTVIEGDLSITGSSLTNLEGLNQINFVGGNFEMYGNDLLTSLNGLENLDSIGGYLIIRYNEALSDIQALTSLSHIGDLLSIHGNPTMTDLSGLGNLETIGTILVIGQQPGLTSLQGLNNLKSVGNSDIAPFGRGVYIANNPSLTNLSALGNLQTIKGRLSLYGNNALTSLTGLEQIITLDTLHIEENGALVNLNGLNNLNSVEGNIAIHSNAALNSLSALSSLHSIRSDTAEAGLSISGNNNLQSLAGLENLTILEGHLSITASFGLQNLQGLEGVTWVKSLELWENGNLNSLSGLDSLRTVEDYILIQNNNSLTNLQGLNQLESAGGLSIWTNLLLSDLAALESLNYIDKRVNIWENTSLSDCSIFSVCNQLLHKPGDIAIRDNAPGCNSLAEVELECNGIPVLVRVLRDSDGDCEPDDAGAPATGVHIRMNANSQTVTRPTNANGVAKFGYLDEGIFVLSLPQFPTENWSVCQDTLWVDPADFQDTIRATFLLQPLNQCPDLSVNLNLPNTFRGCLVSSVMQVDVRNLGTVNAENTQVAVVLPSVLNVLSSTWPIAAQNGGTLFFNIGNLAPFEGQLINLNVRTQCDVFLLGQTLCVEAFATAENTCLPIPLNFSEVRLFSECLDDETVRFTLKNVGNAPTQGMHEYVIIEDEVILMGADFDLDPSEETTVDVPANGATYRMEATRYMNGTLTAVALENCGGLTPGLVTAHWLDEGPEHYDFDCREVILAYDPNQKTAIPKGIGEAHLLAANRPLQYTIDFQNTGTDTAFRVQLTDILSPHLDVNTFRPGFSSHPYSWEIRGLDTLVVLFFPIALPDSNVNVEGSQGFFTFDIQQKPDLPDGTLIENTASIVFDFNPPIVTNTTFHTIGELVVVFTNEPGHKLDYAWSVRANPVKAAATFEATRFVAGEKRFELFDAAGRKLRTERFEGQEFTFQRESLSGGLYFFRISDAEGRTFSGKIVVAN